MKISSLSWFYFWGIGQRALEDDLSDINYELPFTIKEPAYTRVEACCSSGYLLYHYGYGGYYPGVFNQSELHNVLSAIYKDEIVKIRGDVNRLFLAVGFNVLEEFVVNGQCYFRTRSVKSYKDHANQL